MGQRSTFASSFDRPRGHSRSTRTRQPSDRAGVSYTRLSEIGTRLRGRSSRRRGHDSLIVDPADGRIPYQPWALAKRTEVLNNHNDPTKWEHVDPHTRCFLSGDPTPLLSGSIPDPPTSWVRGDPPGVEPRLAGHPPGRASPHWIGDFHSDAVRITERFTIVGPDRIDYEATFEDPNVYTSPFTMALTFGRTVQGEEVNSYELLESACHEGNRAPTDRFHRLGGAARVRSDRTRIRICRRPGDCHVDTAIETAASVFAAPGLSQPVDGVDASPGRRHAFKPREAGRGRNRSCQTETCCFGHLTVFRLGPFSSSRHHEHAGPPPLASRKGDSSPSPPTTTVRRREVARSVGVRNGDDDQLRNLDVSDTP